jgi:hypothetical protein
LVLKQILENIGLEDGIATDKDKILVNAYNVLNIQDTTQLVTLHQDA